VLDADDAGLLKAGDEPDRPNTEFVRVAGRKGITNGFAVEWEPGLVAG